MGIFDLFSKRQKKLRGEVPDVYTYDAIPNPLRVQIVHIWTDTLGNYNEYIDKYLRVEEAYKFIVETLCREYGLFNLIDRGGYSDRNYMEELINFFLKEDNNEKVIDAIELSFRCIDGATRNFDYRNKRRSSEIADEAILELNSRFREHGIGYQYADREIIRIDSELIHSEVVKPALKLLQGKFLAGAQQEFLKAHEHFRKGNTIRSPERVTQGI
jgi:AbiJ-like protein